MIDLCSSSEEEVEENISASKSYSFVARTPWEIQTRLRWGEHNINSGRLRELPMIAIDKFHGEDVLQANTFFLTHLHTDHMVGLEFSPFLDRLEQPGVKLYTSSATPLLFPVFDGSGYLGGLEKIHELIRCEKIIPVDVNERFELDYVYNNGREHKKVNVTLVPAGHCPGSVMLLFEYDSERILYTGDFRLNVNEIRNLTACCYQTKQEYLDDYPDVGLAANTDFKSKLKRVTHLYLDTTFCSNKGLRDGSISSSSSSLVTRDNAIEHILPKIKEHLKHKNNVIQLEFSARVSHEYAIVQFNKLLKQKTHVSRDLYTIYSEIDSCVNAMTLDSKASIHLCKKHETCLEGKNILKVKFSAMWFTMGNGKSTIRERGNYVNVCYSMHASMKEMGAMITSFNAKVVTPLVLPRNLPRSQIEAILRSVTSHKFQYKDYEKEPIVDSDNEDENNSEEDDNVQMMNKNGPISSSLPQQRSNKTCDKSSLSPILQPRKRAKISWDRERTPSPTKF